MTITEKDLKFGLQQLEILKKVKNLLVTTASGLIKISSSSNVNVVQELVDMIETQRAYEVSSKTITSVDEMMRYLAQNV